MIQDAKDFTRQLLHLSQTSLEDGAYQEKLKAYLNDSSFREGLENLDKAMSEALADKPNFPVQLISLIEEITRIYDGSLEDSLAWRRARKAAAAYNKLLAARRALVAAQHRLRRAEGDYQQLSSAMGLDLVLRFLLPGGEPPDPGAYFLSLDEVISRAKAELNWSVTPSQIRFYTRRGIVNRPVRVGKGGHAVYPITVMLRLSILRDAQREGMTLNELRRGYMTRRVKQLARQRAQESGDIYQRMAGLVDLKADERVRMALETIEGLKRESRVQ